MIKKNIPNFITCLNLLCGCIGIVFAFEGNLVWSAYMVGIAAVLDFLDGFAARILKVHSEIGKQLDSLADMVSFGVLPGVVMFNLLQQSFYYELFLEYWKVPLPNKFNDIWYDTTRVNYIPYIAFLIPVFSAIRLAKFNIDTRQTNSFIGLPTPANSIFICSLPLILFFGNEIGKYFLQTTSFDVSIDKTPEVIWDVFHTNTLDFNFWISRILFSPYFLISLTLISSLLLVAPLPLFALKFKNFSWTDNKIRYIFLALCVPLLILFQFVGIPIIIVFYILLSIANNFILRITNK